MYICLIIYIYICISASYTVYIHTYTWWREVIYFHYIHIMKIQCQNIMLNNLMSISVSSAVELVFPKAVFIFFFAVSRVHRRV